MILGSSPGSGISQLCNSRLVTDLSSPHFSLVKWGLDGQEDGQAWA